MRHWPSSESLSLWGTDLAVRALALWGAGLSSEGFSLWGTGLEVRASAFEALA